MTVDFLIEKGIDILILTSPFLGFLSLYFNTPYFNVFRDLIIIIVFTLQILKGKFKIHRQNIKSVILVLLCLIWGISHVLISRAPFILSLKKFSYSYFWCLLYLTLYYRKNYIRDFLKRKFQYLIGLQLLIMVIFFAELLYGDSFLTILYGDYLNHMHRNLLGKTGIRLVSIFINPINFGFFQNINLILNLYFIQKKYIRKTIAYYLIFIQAVTVLLTFSLVNYLILFSTFVILFVYLSLKNRKHLKKFLFLFTIGLVVITLYLRPYLPDINLRISHLFGSYVANNSRKKNWTHFLDVHFFSNNFIMKLWGSGLGVSNSSNLLQTDVVLKVENMYITKLGEEGIIGSMFFIFILIFLVKNSLDLFEYSPIFLMVISSYLIGGISNDLIYNYPFSLYFNLVMFVILETYKYDLRSNLDVNIEKEC